MRFHWFINKYIASFLFKLVYLSGLSSWLHKHPCKQFNSKLAHENRYDLYQHVLDLEDLGKEINYLEFGVFQGGSLKWWIGKNKNSKAKFVGFDTFTGLPEAWGGLETGHFDTEGKPPQVNDDRCSFEVGLFQDTLPGFLKKNKLNGRNVIHIDCDLFTSTIYTLTMLAPSLKKGDVILFDEFGSLKSVQHEYRALMDFVSAFRLDYEVLGAAYYYRRIAIKLLN